MNKKILYLIRYNDSARKIVVEVVRIKKETPKYYHIEELYPYDTHPLEKTLDGIIPEIKCNGYGVPAPWTWFAFTTDSSKLSKVTDNFKIAIIDFFKARILIEQKRLDMIIESKVGVSYSFCSSSDLFPSELADLEEIDVYGK